MPCAVRVAGRWTDRNGYGWPAGRDCRSCRTPLIGVMGVGVVRDDDIVGGGGGIRVERGDERQAEECSDDLGGDETGRGAGRDPGEGVGEDATDGDGGVGERRAA